MRTTYPIKSIFERILIWIFIVDIVLVSALFLKLFFPWSTHRVGSSINLIQGTITDNNQIPGPATLSFIKKLETDNLRPVFNSNLNRSAFRVNGQLITLSEDNIQIFEYPNHDMAMTDASNLAFKYTNSSRSTSWKNKMHLYINDTLVVFYMGNQIPIVSALEKNAGFALNGLPSNLIGTSSIAKLSDTSTY